MGATSQDRGSTRARRLDGRVCLPDGPSADGWLVAVHGISRRAREQAELLGPMSRRLGLALAAPRFGRRRFDDYQRLGRAGRGERADLALLDWLDALAGQHGIDARRVWLVGYSGGAQFVHRFALVHPDRVRGYVAAAPGWFTWPDTTVRFPFGAAASRRLPDAAPCLDAWLRVPAVAAVGTLDSGPHQALRDTTRVRSQQGGSRIERARAWVAAMNARAVERGIPPHFGYEELPGAGHSFRRCVSAGGLDRVIESALCRMGLAGRAGETTPEPPTFAAPGQPRTVERARAA